ncbi:MAG: glycosyltransferase family 4 protein [bacterium]|nr:glycosyltransferase family 4 protein [Candidatus Kapabacteria bacterium]
MAPRPVIADTVVRAVRPRLLIIGPLPPPYIGPAIATRRLLDSDVIAKHFEVDFVNTGDPEGFDQIGQLGLHNIWMAIRHGAECFSVLFRRRPHAIYVPIARGMWGFIRDLLFLFPARLFGARVIVHLRAGRFDLIHDNGWLGRTIARIGLSVVDRALVLGSTVRHVYGGAIAQDRVDVVPNGMQLDGWNASEWALQRASTDDVRIAYIANLFHGKGIHVMLDAMVLLKKIAPEVSVTFAGDWGNPQYRDECLDHVERHGLADRVSFVGRIDDEGKRALLARSHIAAFVPVKPEGLPWVVLEAMSSALPVIGTAQGTIPELVIEGANGFIVPVGDAEALAKRIAELVADADKRQQMGAKGRERVEQIFAEEKTHGRLAAIVLECIDGRR